MCLLSNRSKSVLSDCISDFKRQLTSKSRCSGCKRSIPSLFFSLLLSYVRDMPAFDTFWITWLNQIVKNFFLFFIQVLTQLSPKRRQKVYFDISESNSKYNTVSQDTDNSYDCAFVNFWKWFRLSVVFSYLKL